MDTELDLVPAAAPAAPADAAAATTAVADANSSAAAAAANDAGNAQLRLDNVGTWTTAKQLKGMLASASVAGVLLDAVRAGGLRRIYVGYASALARGVPGAAVVFSVYGAVHERLGGGS